MKGESSTIEERKLLDLLLETPQDQLSQDERVILELQSYAEQEEDEEDIFTVDYTDEYDKVVKPARTIPMWHWVAAAARVAGVLTMFLMPPKTTYYVVEDNTVIAKVKPAPIVMDEPKEDIPKPEPVAKEGIEPEKESKTMLQKAVSQSTDEPEPEDEPVQMSEDTRMELLMAYLSTEEQMARKIDPEEEIRKLRQRGERLLNMCSTTNEN